MTEMLRNESLDSKLEEKTQRKPNNNNNNNYFLPSFIQSQSWRMPCCDKQSSKPFRLCPFTLGLFVASTLFITLYERSKKKDKSLPKGDGETSKRSAPSSDELPVCQVVFVLGGPGAGKGTQCELIVKRKPGWAHLSSGDLLRAERNAGSEMGELINSKISAGQLVPSSITVKLIGKAMAKLAAEKGITNFLIDGFPRSFENTSAWQDAQSKHNVKFALFFECPEEVLVGRLLERGQTSGRNDDTIDIIRKRFRTFQEESMPVLDDLEKKGTTVHKIASDKPVEQVYEHVSKLF